MSLSVEKVYVLLKATQIPVSSTFSDLEDKVNLAFTDALVDGIGGDDAADSLYHSSARALGTSASETFDFAGGVQDKFGNALTMATVKCLFIKNTSTVATLEVGGNVNAWEGWTGTAGSTITVGPGGCILLYDPSANAMEVTAATADILEVTNNSGTDAATYDILVVGATSLTA